MKPPIWFERPVLSDLVDDVAGRVIVLGPPDDGLYQGVEGAVGALAGSGIYDANFMDHAPRVLAIARMGIGVDTVDISEATRRGIAVCNAPDGPTVSTAEHAIMLLLMVAKHTLQSIDRLRRTEEDMYGRNHALELMGKKLGLVGYGRIARRVGAAALGLGMEVMVYDPFISTLPDEVVRAPELAELLSSVDAVSVHIPLTAETRHLFDAAAFATMRDGSIFINTARGGLVDQRALLAAVDSGHLWGAGLDVTEPEPLPSDHPLLQRENVIVTPHVASGTTQGKRNSFTMALDQLIEVAAGNRPSNLVNPAAWERVAARWREEWAT